MISHRSAIQQKFITWFLACVLITGGVIAGMRLSSSPSQTEQEIAPSANVSNDIDLSGEWIGTTTEDYGLESRYDYRIVFEQDGNKLDGRVYLTMTNHEPAIYSETTFAGTVEGDTVFYAAEEIIVLENAVRSQMCLAQTTVTHEVVDGQEMLVGTWVGQPNQQPGCDTIAGHVLLTRQSD